MKSLFIHLFLTGLIACSMAPWMARTAHAEKKDILILNSYHQGYEWTDLIVDGIRQTFREYHQDPVFHIEYMDTKRVKTTDYLNQYRDLLQLKYSNGPIDAVIVSDDNAFQFMLKHHENLFKYIPMVFCGVNRFSPSMIQKSPWCTGVVQHADIKATIDLAVTLHPDARHLVVLSDNSETGMAYLSEVKTLLGRISKTDPDLSQWQRTGP